MFYSQARQLRTSFGKDLILLPAREDRIAMFILLAILFIAVPLFANEYWLGNILIPVMILSIAAIGANLLMGYAGQFSLGTGGLMMVGAYTSFKLATNVPHLSVVVDFFIGGLVAAAVGVIFGLTSLRLRAFYLAIATLASQFFLEWVFSKYAWFWNYHPSGVASTSTVSVFGFSLDTDVKLYLFVLIVTIILAVLAKNIVRSHIGRLLIAIRDNEIAAEFIGTNIPVTKLVVFATSSFYCGIAGGLWAFMYLQNVNVSAFTIDMSFKIMFMVIIGGMGSIFGSFIGAIFIFLLPLALYELPTLLNIQVNSQVQSYIEIITFGILIIFFLIVEPLGLAKLWFTIRDKIRAWPYPYND